jgi:hypothetical protein
MIKNLLRTLIIAGLTASSVFAQEKENDPFADAIKGMLFHAIQQQLQNGPPLPEMAHQVVSHPDTSNDHPHDFAFGAISDSDHYHLANTLFQDLGFGHVTTAFDSSEYYPDVSPLSDTIMGALTLPYKPLSWT